MYKSKKKRKVYEQFSSFRNESEVITKKAIGDVFKKYSLELSAADGDETIRRGLIKFNKVFSEYVLDALSDDSPVPQNSTVIYEIVRRIKSKISHLSFRLTPQEWRIGTFLYLDPRETVEKISDLIHDESRKMNLANYLLKVVASDERALKAAVLNFFKLVTFDKSFFGVVSNIMKSFSSASKFLSSIKDRAGSKLQEIGSGLKTELKSMKDDLQSTAKKLKDCSITCYIFEFFKLFILVNYVQIMILFKILITPVKFIYKYIKKVIKYIRSKFSRNSDVEDINIEQLYESLLKLGYYASIYYYLQ